MRQTKTFPLLRASQVNSLHPYEIQPPGLVTAKNVYISSSDNAVTLRHDFYTFRDDIQTSVDHWQTTDEDKSDFLNILLTGPNAEDQIYITRMFPFHSNGEIASSTYSVGTVTTNGSDEIVTGSSTSWLTNVWPRSFIKFSSSDNLYLIKNVIGNTKLELESTPAAYTGASYVIYRTHDCIRGLWPMKFDRLAYNYLYNAVNNTTLTTEDQNSNSGPFYQVRSSVRSSEPFLTNFTEVYDPTKNSVSSSAVVDVFYDGAKWVFSGSSSSTSITKIETTTDFSTYTLQGNTAIPFGATGEFAITSKIRYYNSTYYIDGKPPQQGVLGSAIYWKSTDLKTWTPISAGTVDLRWATLEYQVAQNTSANLTPSGIIGYFQRAEQLTYRNTANAYWWGGSPYPYVTPVAYGGGTTVVACGDKIYYSTDEITWTTVDLKLIIKESFEQKTWIPNPKMGPGIPAGYYQTSYINIDRYSSYITDLVWTGSRFVAVGLNGLIYQSSNGSTWTKASSGVSQHLTRVYVGAAGVVIAGGYADTILKSTDHGQTWSTVYQEAGSFSACTDLAYEGTSKYWYVGYGHYWGGYEDANGNFVSVDYKKQASLKSSDGTTWSAFTSGHANTSPILAVEASATTILTSGYPKDVDVSLDAGSTWNIKKQSVTIPDWKSVTRGEINVAVGSSGVIAYSSDGRAWTAVDIDETSITFNDVTFSGETYIAVGGTGTIYTSSDATKWTKRTSGVTTSLNGIAATGSFASATGKAVAVGGATGGDATILLTTNLSSWSEKSAGVNKDLNSVAYDGSALWCAVGEDGSIVTSSDGSTWTSRTSGTSEDLNSVIYFGTKWIAVGDAGTILTSSNGTTWTASTSGTTGDLFIVIKATNRAQAYGESGVGVDSKDGTTWESISSGIAVDIYGAANLGDYVIVVGNGGNGSIVHNKTMQNQFKPVSDIYRSCSFAIAGAYLVLIGTSELEGGVFKYYPRRIRWPSPGTVDEFDTEGSGATDLPGTGQLLDGATIGQNILIFESASISSLNQTDDIFSPFTYQVVHSNMRKISNSVTLDQWCFFLTADGKLQKSNGFMVTEVCQPFDLTKYKDFDDSGPIWLTYDREMRRILCYRPRKTDSEHIMYAIDPDGGTVTSIKLEDVTVAGGGYYQGASGINFARSLPQMPTEDPFVSTLELTDLDDDGEAETPVRVPFTFRWITGNGDAKGTTFADACYNTTASTFLITEDENIYSVAASAVLEWPEYSHFDGAPIITIVNYADASVSGCDVEIIYNGTTYNGYEGVDWTAAVGNNDTAASLDSWLTGTLGLTTSRVNNVITISDACQGGTSADPTGVLVTHTAVDTVGSGTLTRRATGYSGLAGCGWDGTNYVVVSNATYILYSPDLVTWTAATIANRTASDQITCVVDSTTAPFLLALSSEYGTDTHYILKSVDNGVNWTDEGDTPFTGEVLGIQYLNSKFWIVGWDGADGYTAESSDGSTWVTGTLSDSSSFGIFYMNSTYYSAGGNYTNDDWFYSPSADISGGTRNWYKMGVESVAALSCEQITIGSNNFMVAGTYQDENGDYVDYCYWSDNGSRFMPIPKPTPESTVIETADAVWNGSYLLFLGSDHT